MTEREIFLAVLDLPDPADRSHYLDKVCDDPAQRARIEALLLSHDTAGSFLGSPAVKPPEPNEPATQALGSAATPEEANEADDDLKFLDKPRRPDSLGRLGHYEMLQVLGKGGFGIVFRAFDDMLQRVVAVKVMAPQLAATSPARRRFLREARSSAAVRHENVVQVYEVGEQPLPYLAMEFIPGETLQQKLDRCGPLELSEILRIGRQIAEGLAAAHACDLIHRDIKPGNVLLEGGSHKAKITDFGLARAADDASISQSGIIAGTPMFMAPEQALGHKIDQRADLFSLGSVLYQMVSGRPPFRAPSALAVLKRVAEEPPRPIPEIIPETPAWLCGIITKLHAKNPEDRFQSAREVADLLADCEAKLKAKQEVKNILPAKPARWKWAAAATAVLLPVLALVLTETAGVTQLFWGGSPRTQVAKQETPLLAVARHGWGKFEDPDNDCGFTEENGELSITVPGKDHDLSVERGKMNSPRAMQPVDGDFTVQVKVAGKFEPRQMTVMERKAYQGAGIFIRTDDSNYLTLDRGTFWNGTRNTVYANFELRVDGRVERFGKATDLPLDNTQDTSLKIERKGNKFTAYASQEAGKWRPLGEKTMDAPKRLHVGIAAKNTSLEPFTPRYSEFKLIADAPPSETTGPTPVPVAKQEPLPPTFMNSIGMEFVIVPKGKSWLGGGKDKLGDKEVEIPADFYLGKYEVTQEEWAKVMEENPSHFSRTGKGSDAVKDIADADLKRFPVENVSWDQCQLFVEKLNNHVKETGWVYRLPTEVEWEYACRGGPMSDKLDSAFDFYFTKPTNTLLPEQANFNKGLNRTCKVGSYEPNVLGLHDMHGNVWEFCDRTTNKAANKRSLGVIRGGCWDSISKDCRAVGAPYNLNFTTNFRVYGFGLRLARVPAGAPSPEAKTPLANAKPTVEVAPPASTVHDTWLKAIALLPLDQHAAALPAKLKEKLPEFDAAFLRAIPNMSADRQVLMAEAWQKERKPAFEGFEDAWLKAIPSMAGDAQAVLVAAWLRERNPVFEGEVKHTVEGGLLTGLEVPSPIVQDLAPLRALSGLKTLTCRSTVGWDHKAESDAAVLKSLKTLQTVNGKPVAQFWKDVDAKKADFKEWLKLVAALTAKQQAAAVAAKIKEHNPDFDGNVIPKIEEGVVTELTVKGGNLTDLSPVRALIGLRSLWCDAKVGGVLSDLSPLKDMKLTSLVLRFLPVTDLAPLKDMKLTSLTLISTRVTDLAPLRDNTTIMTLKLGGSPVSDLSPLKEMKLTSLLLSRTRVTDLTPLKGMPLTHLNCANTQVTDLTPLKGMQLEDIRLDPRNITKGLDILRDMTSLKTIGTAGGEAWPAAEFWERYDKGEFTK